MPTTSLKFFLGLMAVFVPNALVYALQLEESNAYAGFQHISFDLAYWLRATVAVVALTAMLPQQVRLPSHFFLLVYGLFVPLNYVMFNAAAGYIDDMTFLLRFSILVLPMMAIRGCNQLKLRAAPLPFFRFQRVEMAVAGISLLIALIVLSKGPASAGFGLDDVYERRLDGRDIFVAGSPLSYLSTIVINGFTPFLAFMAGVTSKRWQAALAISMAIIYFYVVGLKSPVAFTCLAYAVGLGLRRGQGQGIYRPLAWALATAFAAFAAEMYANQFSLVAEFFFRRVFAVPGDVMQNYYDLIANSPSAKWSAFTGVGTRDPDGVSYMVGKLYYGSDIANVNTNAFLDSLASRGVPGLLFTIGLVCLVTAWADAMFRCTRNPAFMYIGFMYALLVTEQSATTALVSSGIGSLAIILSVSFIPKRRTAGRMQLAMSTSGA